MNHLKSYKLFESSSISFDEIKGIIDDILVDLKDLNDNFSWKVVDFPQKCRLDIYCHDDVSKIKGWMEILDHLFELLISEDLKIYDQNWYPTKPGKINLSWIPIHIINPMTFEYVWMKSFIIEDK